MTDPGSTRPAAEDARGRARELYLDEANVHGCAETAFVVLKEAFGLPDAADSSAAMGPAGRGVIESGAWRDGCMRQVELAVTRLAPLADPGAWATATGHEPTS
jgi:hypothetical protein